MAAPAIFRRLPPKRLRTLTHKVASPVIRTTVSHNRSFFTLPSAEPQKLSATRILPYTQKDLYRLIADVESYSSFVPYCSVSRVTQWSPPDADGHRWPAEADLRVGWGGFNEVFTSRLRCVPGVSVEAFSGDLAQRSQQSSVFKSLKTRWSLAPLSPPPTPSTQVDLMLEYDFANPLYSAVSAAISDKIAGMMIEAFQSQARRELGPVER